jgi:DNA-binding CsgD family transcriptional regulator
MKSNNLTHREMEILKLIGEGLDNRQIAKCLFLALGTVKNNISEIYKKTGIRNRVELSHYATRVYKTEEGDETELFPALDTQKHVDLKLRLIGSSSLPYIIPLDLQDNRPFFIGRFNARIGEKVCDFEFEKNTIAVSRRHASFERTDCGIVVVDYSLAGTYINGKKIMRGEQAIIQVGDRVSFGNAGADYILENN